MSALSNKNKLALRKTLLKARDELSPHEVAEKSLCIQRRLMELEEYRHAQVLFTYCSRRNEVDTRGLIHDALKSGKQVALPLCVDETQMEARSIISLEADCVCGRFGIMEPVREKTSRVLLNQIDLFILPGVGFDLAGNRIGYGKGYFDRFLGSLNLAKPKVGLAYEIQICSSLLSEPHDIRVDKLVTEDRVIYCCYT